MWKYHSVLRTQSPTTCFFLYTFAMQTLNYYPTGIALKRSGDAWPWKAKPYCHSIGWNFWSWVRFPIKFKFFPLRIDPKFACDSQMRSKDMYINGILILLNVKKTWKSRICAPFFLSFSPYNHYITYTIMYSRTQWKLPSALWQSFFNFWKGWDLWFIL